MNVTVKLRRVGQRGPPLDLPRYETAGSAGLDLRADEPVALAPGERKLVPTGLAVEIPHGFEGQVRPRSGLALRLGVGMVNAPGVRAELVLVDELGGSDRGAGGFGSTGKH